MDLSIRKGFRITGKITAQYEFNVFNLTNTPAWTAQDQAQIRQNNGCSATAINGMAAVQTAISTVPIWATGRL